MESFIHARSKRILLQAAAWHREVSFRPIAPVSAIALAFGGQSMGTTSPSQAVVVTNAGAGTATITVSVSNAQFVRTNTCASGPASSRESQCPRRIGTLLGARPRRYSYYSQQAPCLSRLSLFGRQPAIQPPCQGLVAISA